MKRLKKIAVLAAVAATALLVASVAFGAPGDDGSAKFCSLKYGPHKGEVRLMDSNATACHSSEQSVTLATTASIPTPQPAPEVSTDLLRLKYDPSNPGVPQVVRKTAGITATVSNSQCTNVSTNGDPLYECTFDLDLGRSLESNVWYFKHTGINEIGPKGAPNTVTGSVVHMKTYAAWSGEAQIVVIG